MDAIREGVACSINSVTAAVILTNRLPFIALVQLGFQMIYKN